MNPNQQARWDDLLKCHPTPWYLDSCNHSGVEVKDNAGHTVFYEDFGSIPDEMPSSAADKIRQGARAFAFWLVAMSDHSRPNRL